MGNIPVTTTGKNPGGNTGRATKFCVRDLPQCSIYKRCHFCCICETSNETESITKPHYSFELCNTSSVEPGLFSPRQQEHEGARSKNGANFEETRDGFQVKVKDSFL